MSELAKIMEVRNRDSWHPRETVALGSDEPSAKILHPGWIGTRGPVISTLVDTLADLVESWGLRDARTAFDLPSTRREITAVLGTGLPLRLPDTLSIALPISETERIKDWSRLGRGYFANPPHETVTPLAEEYAKAKGLYGSLFVVKAIVNEIMPSAEALLVDLREDFDDLGYATVCFTVTTRESVDRALELDDALQDALIDRIPPHHRLHLSFNYKFE